MHAMRRNISQSAQRVDRDKKARRLSEKREEKEGRMERVGEEQSTWSLVSASLLCFCPLLLWLLVLSPYPPWRGGVPVVYLYMRWARKTPKSEEYNRAEGETEKQNETSIAKKATKDQGLNILRTFTIFCMSTTALTTPM